MFKRTLLAGLLGCTMLAGCNGSDGDSADTQGTYDQLNTKISQLQGDLDKHKQDNQKAINDLGAALAALQELNIGQLKTDIAGFQVRLKTVEDQLAALKVLEPRIDTLANTLTEIGTRTLSSDDLVKLETLQSNFDKLKQDYDAAIKLTTDKASITTLAEIIAKLQAGKADQATINELQKTLKEVQADLDLAKLSATLVDDFKTRIAKLEDDLYKLLNARVDIPQLTQFVNTFIGTENTETGGGHSGNNNPGAQTPFGMVSFSPDNATTGLYGRGVNGYAYNDTNIQFFSLTHLNGPGCRGQGAVPIMPRIDLSSKVPNFKHNDEQASPGFYKVTTDDGITSELTATTRTGMARFTYPADKEATLIIDTRRSNSVKSEWDAAIVARFAEAKLDIANRTVSGHSNVGVFCGGTWKMPVYFYAQFDQPLKTESAVKDNSIANLVFDLPATIQTVQLKIGISSVSIKNAKLNLETENPGWAFDGPDGIRTKADKDWNRRLNTIQLDLAKPGVIDAMTDKKDKAKQYVTQFYDVAVQGHGRSHRV